MPRGKKGIPEKEFKVTWAEPEYESEEERKLVQAKGLLEGYWKMFEKPKILEQKRKEELKREQEYQEKFETIGYIDLTRL